MYVYTYIFIHTHTPTCICVHICVYVYTYVFVYTGKLLGMERVNLHFNSSKFYWTLVADVLAPIIFPISKVNVLLMWC